MVDWYCASVAILRTNRTARIQSSKGMWNVPNWRLTSLSKMSRWMNRWKFRPAGLVKATGRCFAGSDERRRRYDVNFFRAFKWVSFIRRVGEAADDFVSLLLQIHMPERSAAFSFTVPFPIFQLSPSVRSSLSKSFSVNASKEGMSEKLLLKNASYHVLQPVAV